MITLENLTVTYGSQTVISGLNFTFGDRRFYGITGVSGIGKTTLLNCIAGLVTPSGGKITNDFPACSYVFQDARLFPWLTALENVECVCRDRERARHFLSLLLPDSEDKFPDELSGGMKQRVAIARALACDAPLLLLDEPFKGLDAEAKQIAADAVAEHVRGRCAILVSHNEDELSLCDEVCLTVGSPISALKAKSGNGTNE